MYRPPPVGIFVLFIYLTADLRIDCSRTARHMLVKSVSNSFFTTMFRHTTMLNGVEMQIIVAEF